ncbi:MAG: RNA ligase RtcB family protein, partial [Nitrospina sp.]|nr:RNA ligase RtcB family protein [Nitrospina sp.]
NPTASLKGMHMAIGMPDIHPGKGNPVGAAFVSQGIFYPYLVGNDVGCGIGLWQTRLKRSKTKIDRLIKKLSGFESSRDGSTEEWLAREGVKNTAWDYSLGTIGGGNHFAELQSVESIEDQQLFEELGLNKNLLMLLVHSGSRGFGESVLRTHVDKYKAGGLKENSTDADKYLEQHDHAINWAKSNRSLISHRFLSALGTKGEPILDICHNSLTRIKINETGYWLHRKGAAPSDEGALVIAGSRGTFSYLVLPVGEQKDNALSLAHGAGRKWNRGESKKRLISRFQPKQLLKTDLGSRVICEDKDLLYEEAPQAYKNIEIIVGDLLEAGLIQIIARLRPLITYKTGKKRS